ncbi:hypothetical protein [Methanohalobium sp.]|uniref:hypothetical protein n=1 Tax=Methanohalobium sp. TaxID=2837493 RepID=UPI0025EE773E|nr:hypothetical protein [Methanohalobium sp.]
MNDDSSTASLETRLEKLEGIVSEQSEIITDLQKQIDIKSSQISHLISDIEDKEEDVESLKEFRQDVVKSQLNERDLSVEASLSPAEQVILFSWSDSAISKTKNKQRAIKLLQKWDEISKNTAAGKSVKVTDIRKYLTSILDEDIEYMTAKRVAKSIEDITNDKFEYNTDKKVVTQTNPDMWVTDTDNLFTEE